MMKLVIAALLSFPLPPLGPTMGSTPKHTTVSSTATQTELPAVGLATYYAPGVMEKVIVNRERWGHLPDCPECQGYVALLYKADLGRTVCVNTGKGTFGPYMVADVAAAHHRATLIAKGWILDAEYNLWVQWGLPNKPTEITVEDC